MLSQRKAATDDDLSLLQLFLNSLMGSGIRLGTLLRLFDAELFVEVCSLKRLPHAHNFDPLRKRLQAVKQIINRI
jgi:hypothetical protein